ncbi:MAG TPA: alkaline phosphatase family protein [Ktedonobacteraceae bacterium]|nr:alkaline phosphatase family protein [Ktedonobacteraceae bacterium]
MNFQKYFNTRQSRRAVLRQLGTLTAAGLALDACGTASTTHPTGTTTSGPGSIESIKHVVICCQENRTFDTYFGYYPKAGNFGIPSGYSVPDGKGGTVKPHHFLLHDTKDIAHNWVTIHKEWNNGKMDGFAIADGSNALGYYNGSDIPYYYALADSFTLCGNYFCHQLGPTLPNRVSLWAATTGGITQNHKLAPGSLDWPTIIDLLEDHKISWKFYNLGLLGLGSTPEIEFINAMPFFKRWYKDKRLYYDQGDYFNDVKAGTLPQVTFIISSAFYSEHPPLDIILGEKKMASVINALINSNLWTSSALFLTYDEGGGYFDHVPPPQLDAYGLGMRVPTFVVSPWAKRGYISGQLYEHSSILKFLERRFGLPTIASVNHLFDTSTPNFNNDAALGKSSGPPAPPRDGNDKLGDFFEVFDFSQNPNYYPKLP